MAAVQIPDGSPDAGGDLYTLNVMDGLLKNVQEVTTRVL